MSSWLETLNPFLDKRRDHRPTHLAQLLLEHRLAHGLTHDQFARTLRLPPHTLAAFEAGAPLKGVYYKAVLNWLHHRGAFVHDPQSV